MHFAIIEGALLDQDVDVTINDTPQKYQPGPNYRGSKT